MILGLDIGSKNCKSNKKIIFDSSVLEGDEISKDGIKLILNNKHYIIGSDYGLKNMDINKASRDNSLPLLYTLIGMSVVSTEVENYIVVGLPIGQYLKKRRDYRDYILDNAIANFKLNNVNRSIIIKDWIVRPEGLSSVANDYNGIVLDIGGRTIDICLIINKKIIKPTSIPNGTLNLYSNIIDAINNEYSLDLMLTDAERIIENGLTIYGEKQNTSIVNDCINIYIKDIVNKLKLEYSLSTHNLLCVGGGSKTLFKYIKKEIPHAGIVEDPLFSNAIGFARIGEAFWH